MTNGKGEKALREIRSWQVKGTIPNLDEQYEIKLDQIAHNPQIDRTAFKFPKISNEPLPDIATLLKEVEKNQKEIDNILRQKRFFIAGALCASKLLNPRRERFRSRDVIVSDFEPLPGYKPRNGDEKVFGKMAGTLWIDPIDKQVARIEARLVEVYKSAVGRWPL